MIRNNMTFDLMNDSFNLVLYTIPLIIEKNRSNKVLPYYFSENLEEVQHHLISPYS